MLKSAVSLIAILIGSSSLAKVCDYRPSELVGGSGAASVGTAATGVATVGVAAKAAGFYTLTNAITGATMLGSTAGGVSAAGTVGIMGGTAGAIGTVGAVLMAPVTIIAGAVAGTGIAIYEGSCYFTDERVTDYDQVLTIVKGIAASSDPKYFRFHEGEDSDIKNEITSPIKIWKIISKIKADNLAGVNLLRSVTEDFISFYRPDGFEKYDLESLYIKNGILMNRDWGKNTELAIIRRTAGNYSMSNIARKQYFKDTYISINTGNEWKTYDVENLYIVNGVMMHRDWGKNTTIGNIGFYTVDNEAVVSSD